MNGKFLLKHMAKWRLLYVVTLLASLSFAGVNAFDNYAPKVMSDKDDYQPGEVAIITGYGWTQDSLVDIHLEEDPTHDHHHGYHDTKVNPDGSWRIEYPIEERHIGVAFTVVVVGKQTQTEARTYFTDAVPTKVTLSSNLNPSQTGDNVEFTALVQRSGGNAQQANNVSGQLQFFVNDVAVGDELSVTNGGNSKTYSISNLPAGSHVIKAVFTGTNNTATGNNGFENSNSTITQVVTKRTAVLEFGNLSYTYDGNPVAATVTTNPSGLSGVTVTYNGLTTAPTVAGTYNVVATLNNPNYEAEPAIGSLVIDKAVAKVELADLEHTYNGSTKSVTATTDATGGSTFIFTYDGSPEQPVNHKEGGYDVVATLVNDNFTGSATGTLIINKAEQTITWNTPAPITYGTALSATQLNASALANAALTYSPELGTVLNAGNGQTLSVTAAETNNYKAATASVLIDVAKATPTVLLTVGGPYTYSGAGMSVSSAQVNGINGADLGAATVTYKQGETSVGTPVNAGSYDVLAAFAGNENYEAATASGTLVIEKAGATLTASDLNGKVYSGSPHAITVTASPAGLNNGVSIQYFRDGVAIPASGVISAGSYTYTAALEHQNYAAENISEAFSISKATLTIGAENASKVYGEENPAFIGTILSGAVQGESFSVTASSEANAGSDVGTYPITPAVTGTTLDNYRVVKNNGTFTITARPITVTADAGQTKVYGDDDPATYTYQVTTGNLVAATHMTGALERAAGHNVGTYAINKGTLSATANYALTYVGADFEITKRPVTVTADALSKVYGDADPALTYSVSSGSLVGDDSFAGALRRVSGENVSTYAVELGTLSLGNNYSLRLAEGTLFTITRAALSVKANDATKVYGDANPAFTGIITGIKNNDAIVASYQSAANAGSVIGDYAIEPSLTGDALNNYEVTETNGTLSITKAALTVVANDKTRIYGIANPTLDGVLSGVKNNDAIAANYSTVADEASNVGVYVIAAELNDPTGRLGNYTISNTAGKLTITQAPATITVADLDKVYNRTAQGATVTTSPANLGVIVTYDGSSVAPTAAGSYAVVAKLNNSNYSADEVLATLAIAQKEVTAALAHAGKVYDGTTAAPGTTATLDGVISPDDVTTNVTDAVFSDANAGARTVTATVVLAGADKANYTLKSVTPASAAISPRVITVAADAKSKVYGDNDPALTYTVNAGSLVQGESFRGELKREAGEDVGSYTINQNTLTAGDNYALTFTSADLEITRAPLTVKAHDVVRLCGQQNGTLTGTITGIKRSDTITATYSVDADATSTAGTYEISPLPAGAKLSNYEVTVVKGILTIGSVLVDASANSTPQAVKNTATTVVVKVTNTAGGIAANVPVKLYFDNQTVQEVTSNELGEANFSVGTLQTGVYKIRAVAGSGCNETTVYLPVYDPNGGFVTGGGWIDSPAGAYKADKELTGKAHFGFVAKYKKGSTIPDGNTEFQFQAGNLNFNSSAYDDMRLVIAGAKANYKGTGKINGAGNYGFIVSAIDGHATGGGGVDKFRIKIWDKDNGDVVVYDNNVFNEDESAEPATLLGGGSIVIHEAKSVTAAPKSSKVVSDEPIASSAARFDNYPNAFSDRTTIRFAFDTEQQFALEVYDVRGSLIKKVATGKAEAGQVYEYELDARNLAEGVYIARLITGSKAQSIKMILKK